MKSVKLKKVDPHEDATMEGLIWLIVLSIVVGPILYAAWFMGMIG